MARPRAMILHEPRIERRRRHVRLVARLEPQRPGDALPEEVFFEAAEADASWLSPRADAFASVALGAAMLRGEDLEVRGPLSPLLHEGLLVFRDYLRHFFGNVFHATRIESRDPDLVVVPPGAVTVAAFSGGIDSLHTVWRHRPAATSIPGDAIAAGVFLHGFDIPLEDARRFRAALAQNRRLVDSIGVGLVPLRTNARAFVAAGNWERTHGLVLAAAAHAVGGRASRFLVASSRPIPHLAPWGSDPRVDHVLSSEGVELLHDDSAVSRFAKMRALMEWHECAGAIRSCWESPRGVRNCGRCNTCLVAAAMIRCLGWQEARASFPRGCSMLEAARIVAWSPSLRVLMQEMIAAALAQGDRALAAGLALGLARSDVSRGVARVLSPVRRIFAGGGR